MADGPFAIGDVETFFADAWEAHNRAEIAAILQASDPGSVAAARARAEAAVTAAVDALAGIRDTGFDEADRRAIERMDETLGQLASGDPALTLAVAEPAREEDDRPAAELLAEDGLSALLLRTTAAYSRAADAIQVDGSTTDRIDVLSRLETEPDPVVRRRLFLALEPLWRAVDADSGPSSPYQVALKASAEAWQRKGSPVAANARALGIEPTDVEPWLRSILAAWRDVAVSDPVEPWDERFADGAFSRGIDLPVPLAELRRINDASYADLGADPEALGIRYDLEPRQGRGPVPVAFMLDVDIPRRTARGWTTGEQWVFGSYARPRIGYLEELLHETGHAVHYRAIRTRPAFAVLGDASTAFVEALGDVTAWDFYEPAWQARHLGQAFPLGPSLRSKYGVIIRDVAWSLFEIELHRTPERAPNEVWTEITSDYLGIVPHPEWSWWAIRGQLVQSPGYMVHYGLGAIVTADLRARLRELRGDRRAADPGWYAAVSEAIYRWGDEREPGEVLASFLGRPVSPDALLADLRRIAGA